MTSPFHWHIFFLSFYTRDTTDTNRKTREWKKVEDTTCVFLWTVSRSAFSMRDKTTNKGTNIFTNASACLFMPLSLWRNQGVIRSPSLPLSLSGWWMGRNEKFPLLDRVVVSKQASAFHLCLPPSRRSRSRNILKPWHRLLLKELIIDQLRQASTIPIASRGSESRWGEQADGRGKPDEALCVLSKKNWKFFSGMTLLLSTASQPSLWFIWLAFFFG